MDGSARIVFLAGLVLAGGCGSQSHRSAALAPTIDSGLPNRCKVAVSQDRPLVTEWPASEKARLEALSAGQAVAVRYSGCEMHILETCRLPGRYGYRRTTLSSDTIEIHDADDLYAKLPLGAFGLEGELARSGRLAVRTTVSGQLQLEGQQGALPPDPGCAGATHLVTAISVGSFSLLTGGAQSAGGGVNASGVGLGGHTRREESVMRQAGDPRSCPEGNDKAPNPMCASPIQVFLTPLATAAPQGADPQQDALAERRAREQGVLVDIPAPKGGERWKLFDAQGRPLCDAPCSRWIPPRSGYYLERPATSSAEGVRIDIPNEFPHRPGAHVTADYGPERGMPFLSKLTFYGLGIPSAALSVGMGIAFLATDSEERIRSFFLISAIFPFGVSAAASTWWFFYSDEKHFRTRESPGSTSSWLLRDLRVSVGPGMVFGSFLILPQNQRSSLSQAARPKAHSCGALPD